MGQFLLLAALMGAAFVGGNDVVALAAALALLLKELAPATMFEAALRHSVDLGILFLVLGLLLPAAVGSVAPVELVSRTFLTPTGIISLAVGVLSTRLAADGVSLMRAQPEALMGLVLGSLAGVWLLGGIPAGPLVASGLVALLVRLLVH